MRRRELLLSTGLLLTPLAGASKDAAIVCLSGRIGRTNAAGMYRFSEQEWLTLPPAKIVTGTSWTARSTFEGPKLVDVLRHVQAQGEVIRVLALNDYSTRIPVAHAARYGAILAHSMNGQRMRNNHFGPIWLMYPRDQYRDELAGPVAQARFVWQVSLIEVL